MYVPYTHSLHTMKLQEHVTQVYMITQSYNTHEYSNQNDIHKARSQGHKVTGSTSGLNP
jgi:hypothetical protein